jgi:aminopeptidase YwaD
VISASLQTFNVDSTGADRHLDAIQFRKLDPGLDMPTAQISPRTLQLIGAAVERAAKRGSKVRLRFRAEVIEERRPLRTLMAVIEGAKVPVEAVAMVSHVQEPGACDNATGVAGLVEGARSLVELLREQKLPWPDRTLVFLWGDEFRQSESWLASTKATKLKPVVGISSDMTGQSKETGAKALLERNFDPGSLRVLTPDFHTPWGAGKVTPEEVKRSPNGLPVIARCALADVSLIDGGKWPTDEHPWEGGSDHDIFIRAGIPAVLFWHFTDFAYHTSLDRMQFVDPEEMRRTGVALLSTALAVASACPADLDRYIDSLERERMVRVAAAEEVSDQVLAEQWTDWCVGAREWLRNLCLGIDEKIPATSK